MGDCNAIYRQATTHKFNYYQQGSSLNLDSAIQDLNKVIQLNLHDKDALRLKSLLIDGLNWHIQVQSAWRQVVTSPFRDLMS